MAYRLISTYAPLAQTCARSPQNPTVITQFANRIGPAFFAAALVSARFFAAALFLRRRTFCAVALSPPPLLSPPKPGTHTYDDPYNQTKTPQSKRNKETAETDTDHNETIAATETKTSQTRRTAAATYTNTNQQKKETKPLARTKKTPKYPIPEETYGAAESTAQPWGGNPDRCAPPRIGGVGGGGGCPAAL